MKLHRNLCEAVVGALGQIFTGNQYADKVIEKTLKQNPKWGGRDRKFIAETTYDSVRWYRLYRSIADSAEDDYWALLAAWCVLNGIALPSWQEFAGFHPDSIRKRFAEAQSNRRIRESYPDWLDDLAFAELGERWDAECHALNQPAQVVLRANSLKVDTRQLQTLLTNAGIATSTLPGLPQALVLAERRNIFGEAAFRDGLFEVQDASSQRVAPFLRAEPGLRVIDACAGAGGKTLHLAALMQNKGRIIAMDTEAWKLDELRKRARRAGATNIETKTLDSTKVIKRQEASADRLLLDVPCSGLGVLRRNPDAKWKLSPEFVGEIREVQRKLLDQYTSMLKPGGFVAYSTCSLLPSENERQTEAFLSSAGGKFTQTDEMKIFPSEGFDGFYMALLRKG